MTLTVTAVDRPLFQDEVYSLTAPGISGELTVLSHHEAFITLLKQGILDIRRTKDAEIEHIEVSGGVLEVSGNQATILL